MQFKPFAEDKLNVAKRMISLFDRGENTVGKVEIAGKQHVLLFLQCLPKYSSLALLKDGNVWLGVNSLSVNPIYLLPVGV